MPDGYLGIGDSFWNYGKDFKDETELRSKLRETYDGQECLVLEKVRPRKDLGVHALDILTVRTKGDDLKVLSALLWTDCTTDTSHSCERGYVIDVETETIVSAAAWYTAGFAQ